MKRGVRFSFTFEILIAWTSLFFCLIKKKTSGEVRRLFFCIKRMKLDTIIRKSLYHKRNPSGESQDPEGFNTNK